MKLTAKLMLVFFSVVALMTAVGSYFTVRRSFEQFRQRQEQMVSEMAQSLDRRLAEAWREGGAEGLARAIRQTRLGSSVHRIRWVWFEQARQNGGSARTAIVERLSVNGATVSSMAITDGHGERHLHTIRPVDLGNAPQGGLELMGSLEELDAQTRTTIATSLISLGMIAIASLALVYLAGLHWVAHPLELLISKTRRISQGDFGEPLAIKGHDELSDLARAINEMSDRLASQQQQIETEMAGRLATLQQLRHADRLKTVGRLAAGLAHELGTPLNVMAGRAGLIASGKLSDSQVRESAVAIKSEADRVTALIRRLLDFARPNKPQRATFDLVTLLRETISLLRPLADKRGVEMQIAASPTIQVFADRGQLQQVLTNLLVNAIQAMPDGGTVKATPAQGDDVLRPGKLQCQACASIAICDRGNGIAPDHLEQIFEPFFTTKEVGDGTGLGLSISYGIMQEHNGWIDVQSELGRGSCFTIYLPRE